MILACNKQGQLSYTILNKIFSSRHTKYERSTKVSHVHNHNEKEHDEIHLFTHTVNCPVYVPYNEEKQEILLPSTTEMSRKENMKALYAEENINEWNADPYLNEAMTDNETFFICTL